MKKQKVHTRRLMLRVPTNAVALVSVVDPAWVLHVTGGKEGYKDAFGRGYSGYWAYGVEHHPKLGWLVYEQGGSGEKPSMKMAARADAAWRAGERLPRRWFRFDVEAATKAWAAGVKRYGEGWFENGDGPRYDWALQHGLGITCVIDGKTEARYG